MSITIFNKEYKGYKMYDLDRDVSESIIEDYNPLLKHVPFDENGFQKGKFTVTITWRDE